MVVIVLVIRVLGPNWIDQLWPRQSRSCCLCTHLCLCVFVDIRLKSHCHLLSIAVTPSQQERPYHDDSTASRLLSEVKHRRARLVLRWGTTLESRVLFFCYYYYFCRGRSLFLLWIVPKNSAGIFFTVTKTTVTTTTTSLVSTQLSSICFLVLSHTRSQTLNLFLFPILFSFTVLHHHRHNQVTSFPFCPSLYPPLSSNHGSWSSQRCS